MAVQQQQLPRARYVDRADPAETFADSIHNMFWDGSTVRIEFCVTRYPAQAASAETPPEQHPACRLVLTAPVAAELFNRLQQTMNALTQAGIVAPRKPQEPGQS
jgi:hypothetical protein